MSPTAVGAQGCATAAIAGRVFTIHALYLLTSWLHAAGNAGFLFGSSSRFRTVNRVGISRVTSGALSSLEQIC